MPDFGGVEGGVRGLKPFSSVLGLALLVLFSITEIYNHKINHLSRILPHHQSFIVPAHRIQILILCIKHDSDHVAGMSPVCQGLRPLQGRISIQVYETPVIPSCNYVFGMVSIDPIDMIPTGGGGENTLNPPAQLNCIGCPLLISELRSSTLNLLSSGCVKE